jgi:predicted phage terminase large subunit-like protein
MADALDKVINGQLKRVIICAPPRGSKSEMATRRLPPFFMGKFPDRQIITACYGDALAHDMGKDVRGIIKETRYLNLFPDVRLAADTRAAGRWNTNKGGIYISCGVGGPIVGRGFHIGLIDDPFKGRKEADSPLVREDVWKWYWGNFYTRRMPDFDDPVEDQEGWGNAAIVLIMTRWHQDDLAGRLLKQEGSVDEGGTWTEVDIPAIRNEDSLDEESFWPEAFPIDELQATRAAMISAGRSREWSAQYKQRPTVEEGTFIKRAWFENRYQQVPEKTRIYIASDYATVDESEGSNPNFTEHGVFGMSPNGDLYVLDWWFGRTESDVWVEKLLDLVLKWHPNAVFGEKGQIVRSVGPYLRRRKKQRSLRFRLELIARSKDKQECGRGFQAMASSGEVLFPEKTPWAERVVEQCVGFPSVEFDDAFDVMSLMCMAIDIAHPALSYSRRSEGMEKRRDRWRVESNPTSWKTV